MARTVSTGVGSGSTDRDDHSIWGGSPPDDMRYPGGPSPDREHDHHDAFPSDRGRHRDRHERHRHHRERPPCFAEGTRVATESGLVAVEALRAGDLVLTASGGVRIVRWIGFRHIDLTLHPEPEHVLPIRVIPGAFADGVPCRDLWLSPEHAVLLNGMLIPVRLLRNGASIVREDDCRAVTYYHVELDSHDVLLAEGLAAESYLDTGNRASFENAAIVSASPPDFGGDQARREVASCAPFVSDPERVEPVWRMLAERAAALGMTLPAVPETTADPAPFLVINGRMFRPVSRDGERHAFMVPAGSETARLVSNAGKANAHLPWIEDTRHLGVAVYRMTWHAGGRIEPISLDDPRLRLGWWDLEGDRHRNWRWTDGDAALPLPDGGPAILELELGGGMSYSVR
jgi:hypothetical protein